jgi:hypothetical protein
MLLTTLSRVSLQGNLPTRRTALIAGSPPKTYHLHLNNPPVEKIAQDVATYLMPNRWVTLTLSKNGPWLA